MPDLPRVHRHRLTRPAVKRGGSATIRDTSRAYQRKRARILRDEPLCRYCRARGHITAARVLDHIVALSLGGNDADSNLAPACEGCNNAKAQVERRCQGYGVDALNDPALAEWIRLARIR